MAKAKDSYPPYKPAVILKELRTKVGMTQPELGELTGFSRDDIANFERAATGSGSGTLITIDDALKCYEALATADKCGDALAAALSAASAIVYSANHEVEQVQKYLAFTKRNLSKVRAVEKRIKAQKHKLFPHHKADENLQVYVPSKKQPVGPGPQPWEPGGRFNPARAR
jgi:transcriptional regulator with XRE-family HTH domain